VLAVKVANMIKRKKFFFFSFSFFFFLYLYKLIDNEVVFFVVCWNDMELALDAVGADDGTVVGVAPRIVRPVLVDRARRPVVLHAAQCHYDGPCPWSRLSAAHKPPQHLLGSGLRRCWS